jgi:hypothetical protein
MLACCNLAFGFDTEKKGSLDHDEFLKYVEEVSIN